MSEAYEDGVLLFFRIGQQVIDSLDNLLANQWEIFDAGVSIVDWLYELSLPASIVNNLMEMIIEHNFDLTNKDDRLWFATIVTDRLVADIFYHSIHGDKPILGKVVAKYIDKVSSASAKRQLADNLRILLNRYESGLKQRNELFEQDAQKYASRWVQFESQSKQINDSLLNINSNNNESKWKCYHCTLSNDDNVNECLGCRKGMNPLWPARTNKSETFCVSKPFGLIKWDCQVCST